MNVLLLIGFALFFGVFGGKFLQKFKIPMVVGYIMIGVAMGRSALGLFQPSTMDVFTPLVDFTLGIIGFLIGAELKSEVFKKHGRSIYLILISEGVLAFVLVFVIVTFITKKVYLGLLLGAIASATDPASTVNVLWEYKSRGPLTTTLTSIVALDDGLALILYGLVSVFSRSMIAHEHYSLWGALGSPLLELAKCLAIGGGAGLILVRFIKRFSKEVVLPLVIGAVAMIVGLAVHLELDLILTTMVMGAVIANAIPKLSENLFKDIKGLTTSLYIFFFVFVGARLDVKVFLQVAMLSIVVAYLLGRSAGKIFGAMFGGYLAKAKKTVTKYSGLCLFTQGGVAIGLAMSIAHNFDSLGPEGVATGAIIVNIVAATTFVVQLIGPMFVKFGVMKADEAWRNVTEEDVIAASHVNEFMRTEFSCVQERASLDQVMEAVKETESYHFLVVDSHDNLSGLISLGELRDVFRETRLDNVILAKDVATPVKRVLYPQESLKKAFDIFNTRKIDYLPVVENEHSKKVVGIIEYQPLVEMVSRKTLERQESLDKSSD